MIELHGWLSVRETYENEDMLSQNTIDTIMKNVQSIIENGKCGIKLQYANGMPFISTLFCSNHRTNETDEIIETYKRVSETASGSYGIIYLHDDEDKKHYNEFQVFVFRKGCCSYYTDTFFSPCIPTVEDDTNIIAAESGI